MKALLAIFVAVMLAACSGLPVSTDYAPGYDFSGLNSYAWLPPKEDNKLKPDDPEAKLLAQRADHEAEHIEDEEHRFVGQLSQHVTQAQVIKLARNDSDDQGGPKPANRPAVFFEEGGNLPDPMHHVARLRIAGAGRAHFAPDCQWYG